MCFIKRAMKPSLPSQHAGWKDGRREVWLVFLGSLLSLQIVGRAAGVGTVLPGPPDPDSCQRWRDGRRGRRRRRRLARCSSPGRRDTNIIVGIFHLVLAHSRATEAKLRGSSPLPPPLPPSPSSSLFLPLPHPQLQIDSFCSRPLLWVHSRRLDLSLLFFVLQSPL